MRAFILRKNDLSSCEELFDGIEIRAVGRQENGTRATSLDCFFDPVDLISRRFKSEVQQCSIDSMAE